MTEGKESGGASKDSKNGHSFHTIGLKDHFAVVCLVAWPLHENEAGVDLV